MLGLRRQRIPEGRAAGQAGTQAATLQVVSRQGSSKVGLDDLAHALFVGGGWTEPPSAGNYTQASLEARGFN
jgi:hypothetical protein